MHDVDVRDRPRLFLLFAQDVAHADYPVSLMHSEGSFRQHLIP